MGSRYVLGWGAVLALAVGASGGTLVLVRQAIGDGNLADPLSQSQVRSRYAAALHPTPTATGRPGATSTSTSANAPTTTPSGSTTHRPGSTTSSGGHTSSGPGSSPGTHPHPGGSSSSSTSHTSPPPSSITRVLTSPGGSVVVRCTSGSSHGTVYLVSWSPAQGYAVNHAQRGPGEEAEIEFESDQSSVSVNYHCTSSGPVQSVETGDAWGGGGDDGGDSGGGGGDS